MKCEKLSAKISVRQCLINRERALRFDEGTYLNKMGAEPHWGFYGVNKFVHPLAKVCASCRTGELLARLYKKATDVPR